MTDNENRIVCQVELRKCTNKQEIPKSMIGLGTYYRVGDKVYHPTLWTDFQAIAECKASSVKDFGTFIMEQVYGLKPDEHIDRYEGESEVIHAILDVHNPSPPLSIHFNDFTLVDEEEEEVNVHTSKHKVRVHYSPESLSGLLVVGTVGYFADKYVS